jgi:hypothetical protein
MIFQHTHEWITGISPHTGKPKTRTSRVTRGLEILTPKGLLTRRIPHEVYRYKIGNTYAIQEARGKPQIARFKLIEIEPFIPAQITIPQAHAEGFATPEDFLELWQKMYGWEACGLLTWGLNFEVIE